MWHQHVFVDVLQVTLLLPAGTGAVVAIRYGHPQPHIHKRIARRIMDQVGGFPGGGGNLEDHLSNEKSGTWLVGLHRGLKDYPVIIGITS